MNSRRAVSVVGLASCLVAAPISADTIRLVYDIEPGIPTGSYPTLAGSFLGDALVWASLPGSSGRLWRCSGDPQQTIPLTPEGSYGYVPQVSVQFGSRVYFAHHQNEFGVELWATDGTAQGTRLVVDLYDSSYPEELTVVGDRLYFTARHSAGGRGIWLTDGTEAGTQLITEIDAFSLAAFGDSLCFVGYTPATGGELWSVGGSGQVSLVRDIAPGSASGCWTDSRPVVLGDSLLFVGGDATTGAELWRTDGTEAGTLLVRDIRPGSADSSIRSMVRVGEQVFFHANGGGGTKLWKTDGTEAGTVQVGNVSIPVSTPIVRSNGLAFVRDSSGVLWRSDGSADGTFIVSPTGVSVFGYEAGPTHMYFHGNNQELGEELWHTDGSAAGTRLVVDLMPFGSSLVSGPNFNDADFAGDRLFYCAQDGTSGMELFVTDGSSEGTHLAMDFVPTAPYGRPSNLFAIDGRVIYTASELDSGLELWTSDGTAAGTFRLCDCTPGGGGLPSSQEVDFTPLGDRVIALFTGSGRDGELWVTDGTAVGTSIVADLADSGHARSLLSLGDRVLVSIGDAEGDVELWATDGTAEGTSIVKDIRPGAVGSFPGGFTRFREGAVFSANDGSTGTEPWITDGTEAGTIRLADVRAGANSSNPAFLGELHQRVLFAATTTAEGRELWVTDGTTSGTLLLLNINPGAESSSPQGFALLGGYAYFRADDGVHGTELWRTDGTPEGTELAFDLAPGAGDGIGDELIVHGDRLYFSGLHNGGFELYSSDGEQPVLVRDLRPGPAGSDPRQITSFAGRIYFVAAESFFNRRLWRTDGTAEGTVEIVDSQSGRVISSPVELTVERGRLFLSPGNDPAAWELWMLEPDPDADLDGDGDTDLQDLAYLLANFGTAFGATNEQGDTDFDGDVDLQDLGNLLSRFGV